MTNIYILIYLFFALITPLTFPENANNEYMIDDTVFTARGRYTNPLPCTLQAPSIDPRLTLTFYLPPT